MEGHTQGHLKRNKEDVLFRIPKTSYFRTRYKEISVIIAHSSEIETKKSLIIKEKRLDLLGSLNRKRNLKLKNESKKIKKSGTRYLDRKNIQKMKTGSGKMFTKRETIL